MRSTETISDNSTSLKLIFRAFHYRNYRLFFAGQGISLVGTWMQQIAMSWLVYRLTNSAFLLGAVGFAGQITTFIFAPLAGVLVDRWNRRHILIVTQTLAMLQALILAFLDLTGTVAVWHIVFLGIFLGLINAIDIPARQTFVVEMVEKREDLGNAIALNSSMFNAARLVGPAIGGVLIATVGEGIVFLFNSVSFLAAIAALLAIKTTPQYTEAHTDILSGMKEGFSYAFTFAPTRSIILLLGLVSLMGMSYQVLMPVFAKDILHGGAHTLGFLTTASGAGALVGTIYLASRKNVLGLGKMIPLAASIFGAGLIAFSLSHVLAISLLLMLFAGFGMMVQMTASNTTLQTIVDDNKRGRVMAFHTMTFMGTAAFGSLLAGTLAGAIGAPNTLLIGGVSCLLGALQFARKLPRLREMIRPIYIKKGIIPEVALGIHSATELTKPPGV